MRLILIFICLCFVVSAGDVTDYRNGKYLYEKARKLDKEGKDKSALVKYEEARKIFASLVKRGAFKTYEDFNTKYSDTLEKTGHYFDAMIYREKIIRNYKKRGLNNEMIEEKASSFASMLLRIARALEKKNKDNDEIDAKSNPVFYYQKILLLNEYTGRQPKQGEEAMRALFRLRPDIAIIMTHAYRMGKEADKLEKSKRDDLTDAQKEKFATNLRMAERKLYTSAYGASPDKNILNTPINSLAYGCTYSLSPRIRDDGELTNGNTEDAHKWTGESKVEVVINLKTQASSEPRAPLRVAYTVSEFKVYLHSIKGVKAPLAVMAYGSMSDKGPWVLAGQDVEVENKTGWVKIDALNKARYRYVKFVFLAREGDEGNKSPIMVGEIDVIK